MESLGCDIDEALLKMFSDKKMIKDPANYYFITMNPSFTTNYIIHLYSISKTSFDSLEVFFGVRRKKVIEDLLNEECRFNYSKALVLTDEQIKKLCVILKVQGYL